MNPTTTHPNSAEAARTMSHDKARTDRRLIVEYVANAGIEGASDGDLERALVASGLVNPNALRIRRGETEVRHRDEGPDVKRFGLITSGLGLNKLNSSGKRVTAYHVTAKGLKALGRDPATNWHSETKAEA